MAQKCRGAECGKRTSSGIQFTPVACREETSQPATTYSETVPRRPPPEWAGDDGSSHDHGGWSVLLQQHREERDRSGKVAVTLVRGRARPQGITQRSKGSWPDSLGYMDPKI